MLERVLEHFYQKKWMYKILQPDPNWWTQGPAYIWVVGMLQDKIPSLIFSASLHLKMDGWNASFLLGWPIFRGHVSLGSVFELEVGKNAAAPSPKMNECHLQGDQDSKGNESLEPTIDFHLRAVTPLKFNSEFTIENRPKPERRFIFQPSFFRGKLAVKLRGFVVSGRDSLVL